MAVLGGVVQRSCQTSEDDCAASAAEHGTWDVYFNKWPQSNSCLRALILSALSSLKPPPSSEGWKIPAYLMGPMIQWFLGQKHILFAGVSISGFTDVILLEKLLSS